MPGVRPRFLCQLAIRSLRMRAFGRTCNDGPALVGLGADVHVQRNTAEERNSERFRLIAGAAVAKMSERSRTWGR